MAPTGERARAEESVSASLNFMVRTGTKPVTYISPRAGEPTRRDARIEAHIVTIRNGRPLRDRFELERDGFVLTRHETKVKDFYDEDEVGAVYSPEIEALVKEFSGAPRVLVFDHTIRANAESTQKEKQVREPVRQAHNDYTDRSAPQRVRDLLPAEEAEALLERRFAVIQVWRPIRNPVRQTPLAICDAQSISPGDLIETDLKYQDRTGEVLQLAYNPDQSWFYFPDMETNEAMVFKCYDSLTDGRSRFTAHTAFDDPNSPADAPERESIESRALAFF